MSRLQGGIIAYARELEKINEENDGKYMLLLLIVAFTHFLKKKIHQIIRNLTWREMSRCQNLKEQIMFLMNAWELA